MLQVISVLMDGKKVWTGLAIIFAGYIGAGSYWSPDTIGQTVDLTLQLIGLILSAYGNKVAHTKIEKLGRSSFCKSCLELV